MAIRHALLVDPASVEWKILYYVRVPNISDHVGHPIGKVNTVTCLSREQDVIILTKSQMEKKYVNSFLI